MCLLQCGKRLIYLLLVLSWTCSQTELTLSILPFQVDPNEMTHQMYRIMLCKSHLFFGHAFAVSKHKDTWTCQTTLWERLAYIWSCMAHVCAELALVPPLQVLLGSLYSCFFSTGPLMSSITLSPSLHQSISSFESCWWNVIHLLFLFIPVLTNFTLLDIVWFLMLFKHCK